MFIRAKGVNLKIKLVFHNSFFPEEETLRNKQNGAEKFNFLKFK